MIGHMRQSNFLQKFLLVVILLLTGCNGQPESQSTSASPTPSQPPDYEGYYDITNCNAILAWAWDKNRPNEPIKLDIYDGEAMLATVTADIFREDLKANGMGDGRHGAKYATPPMLKDGKPHTIRIVFSGTKTELRNGPKVLNCVFEEPR